jgi:hypothetical protein
MGTHICAFAKKLINLLGFYVLTIASPQGRSQDFKIEGAEIYPIFFSHKNPN